MQNMALYFKPMGERQADDWCLLDWQEAARMLGASPLDRSQMKEQMLSAFVPDAWRQVSHVAEKVAGCICDLVEAVCAAERMLRECAAGPFAQPEWEDSRLLVFQAALARAWASAGEAGAGLLELGEVARRGQRGA